ncbi:MAG: hypothetical protein AABX37_03485 [Nanoarchaeota archaeon]
MAQKKNEFSWRFPRDKMFLKIELYFIALLALFVLIIAYFQFARNVLYALAAAVVFLLIYFAVGYGVKSYYNIQHHYTVTPTHLHVKTSHRQGMKEHKVPLRDIARHKLDKSFYGGYLLTRKGKKHLLYFNSRKEVERFETILLKHMNARRR